MVLVQGHRFQRVESPREIKRVSTRKPGVSSRHYSSPVPNHTDRMSPPPSTSTVLSCGFEPDPLVLRVNYLGGLSLSNTSCVYRLPFGFGSKKKKMVKYLKNFKLKWNGSL